MQLVGSSEAIQRVKAHAAKFAKSRKQVILLTGESGSGKGAVAEYIHSLTGKAKEKFISISVAGLDDNLANSELFGHEKGAFTNALYKHDGAFAQASDGTLFLDEIGDATLPVQLRLLKAIEERKFYSVGGTRLIYSNALVITATNQDLDQKCAAGSFRRDLLARIKTLEIRIPPLRERREDLLLLAEAFLKDYGMSILNERLQVLCISPFTWPDNVRDLQSLIERSHCLSTGSPDSFLAELKDQLRRMEEDETSGYGHPTGLGPSTEDVIENHLLNWKRSEEPLEELLRTSTEESVASVLDRLLNTGWESPEDGKGWGKMLGIPNLENQSRKGFPRNNMCANALLQLSASRALLPETVKRYIEETLRTRGVK